MSVQICAPLPGDTVSSPVTVVAAYSSAASFDMTCRMVDGVGGSFPEPMAGSHPAGSDFHRSGTISITNPGDYTAFAEGTGSDPGSAATSGITVTTGAPPVFNLTVTNIVPFSTRTPTHKAFRIKGECDPALNVAYIICRIWQTNLIPGATSILSVIGAGADTPKAAGPKDEWKIEVALAVDETEKRVQYMAQITAYDSLDNVLGKATVFIKSK